MFARRLDGGDCALFGHGQVDQLPGAAAGFGREVKVVPQQEQERLAGDKLAGTPDRMAITLGLGLDRESEALLEIEEAAGLLFGPFHSLERRPQIGRVVAVHWLHFPERELSMHSSRLLLCQRWQCERKKSRDHSQMATAL